MDWKGLKSLNLPKYSMDLLKSFEMVCSAAYLLFSKKTHTQKTYNEITRKHTHWKCTQKHAYKIGSFVDAVLKLSCKCYNSSKVQKPIQIKSPTGFGPKFKVRFHNCQGDICHLFFFTQKPLLFPIIFLCSFTLYMLDFFVFKLEGPKNLIRSKSFGAKNSRTIIILILIYCYVDFWADQ